MQDAEGGQAVWLYETLKGTLKTLKGDRLYRRDGAIERAEGGQAVWRYGLAGAIERQEPGGTPKGDRLYWRDGGIERQEPSRGDVWNGMTQVRESSGR